MMKIKKLKQTRFGGLRVLIAILLVAGVGSYWVVSSRAFNDLSPDTGYFISTYVNGRTSDLWGGYDSGSPLPPATVVNAEMYITQDPNRTYKPTAPRTQVFYMMSYDTRNIKLNSSTCVWKYGCTVKDDYDLQSAATAARGNTADNVLNGVAGKAMCDLDSCWHKKKVAFCFTIPAGFPKISDAPSNESHAATFQTQRTDRELSDPHEPVMMMIALGYIEGGGCDSNPDFKGVWWIGGDGGWCGSEIAPFRNWTCDNGTGPGSGPGIFTGFGTGNGGTGNGSNGQGQGTGTGAGGGGGGSSAKKIAEQPNSIPDASSQGDNQQTELEPNPFYDGKNFEKGSDADTLAGTVRETSKKLIRSWPTILAVVVLGGVAGLGYWRWRRVHRG